MAHLALPIEIYEHIFQLLVPSPTEDADVFALAQCAATSSFMRSIATANLVWMAHYQVRYLASNPIKETERIAACNGSYFKLYRMRRLLDRRALDTLQDAIYRKQGRCTTGRLFAYDLGIDVHDVLRTQSVMRWPRNIAKTDEPALDSLTLDWIARPYWAREAMTVITKLEALRLWRKVVVQPQYVSFAEGFAAFSGFRGVSPQQVIKDLNALCKRCESHLRAKGVSLESGLEDYDVVNISNEICLWMREEGFRLAAGVDYHRMENHFLDCVITTHRDTLPLSLVVIFVSLARHLGVEAHPVGFPQHVHVLVRGHVPSTSRFFFPGFPERGEEYIHLDIAKSDERLVLPRSHLISILEGMGVTNSVQQGQLLQPANVRDMCGRAGSNVQHSFHTELEALANPNGPRYSYIRDCVHAAMSAFVMLSTPGTRGATTMLMHMLNYVEDAHRLDWCLMQYEVFPNDVGHHTNDVGAVQVRDQLIHMYELQETNELQAKRDADSMPLAVDGTNVEFHVGTLMRHAKFAYIGVIADWNTKCHQPEQWMREMGVDMLSRGRNQPFYTVFAMDGTVRYVAEENVEVHTLPSDTWGTIRELLMNAKNIEMHFDRAEVGKNGVGKFIMGADLRREFPGDVLLAQKELGELQLFILAKTEQSVVVPPGVTHPTAPWKPPWPVPPWPPIPPPPKPPVSEPVPPLPYPESPWFP
ncbi:hypothetical protein DACRYDRAFT_118922 [Dacryopinax primogenitus]|uniref:Hemimethylated DNA-binding domain-containing protein n=1 Tax=Dacryopinax primogenitus (strain DJM 731) TaxID=1858805 RepID=M5FP44_DACPD|nr:uncharacterized protein DACRYDRAFT_118922 [Dacryopinax primogenitus]EJT98195.1 hypothetical protein DACRYDRAFT_118922 [Dacryopinax primogenitus]